MVSRSVIRFTNKSDFARGIDRFIYTVPELKRGLAAVHRSRLEKALVTTGTAGFAGIFAHMWNSDVLDLVAEGSSPKSRAYCCENRLGELNP